MNKHQKTKLALKITGLSLLGIGVISALVGFIGFFIVISKTDNFSPLIFLGMGGILCIGIGLMLTMMGFQREISSYMAKESAHATNEMYKSVAPGIKEFSSAVKEGIDNADDIVCECGKRNSANSQFCGGCGKSFIKTCPSCNQTVAQGNKFCNHCGTKVE